MQLFVLTNHCKVKKHCNTCRNKEGGRGWRNSLKRMFLLPEDNVDFECPWGVPWNNEGTVVATSPLEQVSTGQAVETQPESPAPHSREALLASAAKARQAATSRGGGGGCGCGRR